MVDQHTRATVRAGTELPQHVSQHVDTFEVLDNDALDPQVIAPDPFDQFGVVATLHEDATRQRHLGSVLGDRERPRCGAGGTLRLRHRAGELDGLAVDQEPAPQREGADSTVPVLQLHEARLDAEHGAREAARGVLHDEIRLEREGLGRPRRCPAGEARQHPPA